MECAWEREAEPTRDRPLCVLLPAVRAKLMTANGEALKEVRRVLVFQYGSNCLESEINGPCRLLGDAKFVSIAETVEEFTLAFDVWSKQRSCAASDIVVQAGSKVWGVLYEVPNHLISRQTAPSWRKSFDQIEGEGNNYKHEMIKVCYQNGTVQSVRTYTVRHPISGIKTSIEYVGLIVRGLREHNIAVDYIDKVKEIAAANNPLIDAEIRKL
jgi:hypothetical protein